MLIRGTKSRTCRMQDHSREGKKINDAKLDLISVSNNHQIKGTPSLSVYAYKYFNLFRFFFLISWSCNRLAQYTGK